MLTKFKETLAEQGDDFVFYALLTIATATVMLQLRSLYSTPIPDSYLWWGDESWLMLEFRSQIVHGVFRHPLALASTLQHGSGVILGNMWIPALLYGLPAAIVDTMDVVLLGRTVTAILGFTLLIALFTIVRQRTRDRHIALLAVILLVTSRSFLLTSHSARYDILNALAILIGVYMLLRLAKQAIGPRQAFFFGIIAAGTLLITVHVTLALYIAAAFVVARSAGRWKSLALFIVGSLVFVGVLVLVSALRGNSSVLGASSSGAFAMNVHDIPGLRLYSRSVQFANFAQKFATLSSFAFAYICAMIALIVLLAIAFFRKRLKFSLPLGAGIILIVFASWFEFESAAPTSYLIYILPVLSLAIVLALHRVVSEQLRMWLVLPVALFIFGFTFRDIPSPHGMGYRMMTDNYQAIGAALDQMPERDSGTTPLVLAFNPAVHELLRDTTVRLMTTHFIEFPASAMSVDSVLRSEKVNYVLAYRSAIKPDYMREVGPITDAASRIGTAIWERAGYFTDIGRSYFSKSLGPPDTIRLYRLHD